MDVFAPSSSGYELVDSGDERKLERFGAVLLDRPAPQAIWPVDSAAPWGKADAVFLRGEGGSGEWNIRSKSLRRQEGWPAAIGELCYELRLTGFGNVGLFPEHTAHFEWMRERLARRPGASVLNLFAYTGGASMACARAGACVTHVDAAKTVNAWAISNARATGIAEDRIRFFADDATKLVRREARRGRKYDAIILDPPSFGRGTSGEVWKLERDLAPLVAACADILSGSPLFVLLTSHTPGITPSVLRRILRPLGGKIEDGEMLLGSPEKPLPAGIYVRVEP